MELLTLESVLQRRVSNMSEIHAQEPVLTNEVLEDVNDED